MVQLGDERIASSLPCLILEDKGRTYYPLSQGYGTHLVASLGGTVLAIEHQKVTHTFLMEGGVSFGIFVVPL